MGSVASPFSGGFVPPGAPGSPEAGGAPPIQQPSQPDPSLDALMGGAQQLPAPDPQEHLRAIMRQYRQLEQQVDALASASGPETAPMARVIKDALRKMMSVAVSRPGAMPEPAAPRTLG